MTLIQDLHNNFIGITQIQINEFDDADHSISVTCSSPEKSLAGSILNIGMIPFIVKSIDTRANTGSYTTTIVLGTQQVYADTIIPGGYQIQSQEIKGAIQELFDKIQLDVMIVEHAGPAKLKESSNAIDESTTVLEFINKISKIKKATVLDTYFNLNNEFIISKPNFALTNKKLKDYKNTFDSVDYSTSIRRRADAATDSNWNSPAEPSTIIDGEYSFDKKGTSYYEQLDTPDAITSANVPPPQIDRSNGLVQDTLPMHWDHSITIDFKQVPEGLVLHTAVDVSDVYAGLTGNYIVRSRSITYTPGACSCSIKLGSPKPATRN